MKLYLQKRMTNTIPMKKINIILIIFLISIHYSNAQSLGQDTENFSTIVFPSTNISLNVSDNSASFSLYRDSRIKNEKPSTIGLHSNVFSDSRNDSDDKLLASLISLINSNNELLDKNLNSKYITWGFDFNGKSSNGVAPIFTSDKIASSASVGGLIGYRWKKHKYDEDLVSDYIAIQKNIYKQNDINNKIDELEKNKIINKAAKEFLLTYKNEGDIESRVLIIETVIDRIDKIKLPITNSLDSEIEFLESLNPIVNNISNIFNKKPLDENQLFNEVSNLNKFIENKKYEILIKTIGFNKKNIFETSWQAVFTKIKNLTLQKKQVKQSKQVVSFYNGKQNLSDLKKLLKDYKSGVEKLKQKGYQNVNLLKDDFLYFNRNLIYIRGGFNGSSFKYDLENSGTTTDTRFEDRSFNGYNIELGMTLQKKVLNFIGFSLGYRYSHNLSDLKSQTYALQVIDPTIMNGNFVSVTEVKALNGDYDRFNRLDFNFDYVRLFRLKENQSSEDYSALYLSINPFLRHRIYDNADVLKNNTVLGMSINAYNSKDNKVMGGVYVQTPDLFGTHKNDKGLFDEGINFGLVVRYNFQGLKVK